MPDKNKSTDFIENIKLALPIIGLAAIIFTFLYLTGLISMIAFLVFFVLFISGRRWDRKKSCGYDGSK